VTLPKRSTYWRQKRETLTAPPEPRASARSSADAWPRNLQGRDARRQLQLLVSYAAGPSEMWKIDCRGGYWFVPGAVPFGEVLRWLNAHPMYR
jgi:hypothetical protein